MPFSAITKNVAFSHGPLADSTVAVHFPENFNPAGPFVLCVFLHGLSGDTPFEKHIEMAIAQIKSSSTNTLLVAPRFDGNAPGSFADATGFSSFVGDLKSVLPPLLTQGGLAPADANQIATYAAAKAPIVIVGFSGGWRPLRAILDGLMKLPIETGVGKETQCTARVVGIETLDAIFGEVPHSLDVISSWIEAKGAQTAFVSIFNPTTQLGAAEGNEGLLRKLRPHDSVHDDSFWPKLGRPIPAGTVAFFGARTAHLKIPKDGPPLNPIASFLDLLGDRAPSLTG
jgi:hypothetical protein